MPRIILAMFCLVLPATSRPAQVRPSIDLAGKTATVLVFVGVDCPISNGYLPEVNRIIDRNAPAGVQFVAVYPDADTPPQAVAAHAKAYDIHCRTLIDADHYWTQRTGVTVTPEAAVLSPDGTLLYAGRIDDLYLDFGKKRYAATVHSLQDVLTAIEHHQPVPKAELPLVGCPI